MYVFAGVAMYRYPTPDAACLAVTAPAQKVSAACLACNAEMFQIAAQLLDQGGVQLSAVLFAPIVVEPAVRRLLPAVRHWVVVVTDRDAIDHGSHFMNAHLG